MQLLLDEGRLGIRILALIGMTHLQDRWKKIPGVQFHHLGQIQFRDTPEEYTLLQVNSERYSPV